MFLFHRRILSLPAPTGSLSFLSSRKGTPTYFLFPHLLIVTLALYCSAYMNYPYSLSALDYGYNALEPYIDEQTMHLHHDKHHQAYIDSANKVVADHP